MNEIIININEANKAQKYQTKEELFQIQSFERVTEILNEHQIGEDTSEITNCRFHDTIFIDGNRLNCSVDNILWTPTGTLVNCRVCGTVRSVRDGERAVFKGICLVCYRKLCYSSTRKLDLIAVILLRLQGEQPGR